MITRRSFQKLATVVFVLGLIRICSATSLVLEATWCGDVQYPNRMDCDRSTHLLYVTSPRTGQIAVFDESGALQNSITTVAHPTAIAADGSGHLFVVDETVVRELSTSGNLLMSIGETTPYFTNPHDVAVAQDGRIYVSDVNDSIKVFDGSGAFVRAFGGHGYFAARLDDPVSLTINNTAGELFVADQNNSRIEVFSLNGVYLRTWGALGNGTNSPNAFLRLWGIDRDASGRLWAFDDMLNSVQVFESTGTFDTLYTMPDAALRSAVDIAVDGNHVYVTEQRSHCILVYRIAETAAVDLTISYSPQGMMLRWNAVYGATSYHVERSSDLTFNSAVVEDLGTVADTSYLDAQTLLLYDKRFYQVTGIIPQQTRQENSVMPTWEQVNRNRMALDTYHDSPHNIDMGVNCTSCHFPQFSYPNPFSEVWCGDHLCKSCHVETGKAQPQQNHFAASDTIYCNVCHNPHFQQAQNPHDFIRTAITTPHSGSRALLFNNDTDFVHGAPNFDGICETCHTATAYYRNNPSGDHTHHAASDCLSCHSHLSGFRASP